MAKFKNLPLKIRLLFTGTALAFLAGSGWAFFAYYDYYSVAGQYDLALAEYQRAGMPVAATNLAPNPPISIADNAAPLLREAFNAVTDKQYAGSVSTDRAIRAWQNAGDYSRLLHHAKAFKFGIGRMERAVTKSKLDYGRDWDRGEELQFPEYAKTKWFVKKLTLRAEAYAGIGNAEAALSDLTTAWKLSRLAGTEPLLMSYLSGAAGEAVVLAGIQRCASKLPGDQAFLSALDGLLKDYRDQDLRSALRGEIYYGLTRLRAMKIDDWTDLDYPDVCTPFWYDSDALEPLDTAIERTLFRTAKGRAMTARYLQAAAAMGRIMDRTSHDPRLMCQTMVQDIEKRIEVKGKSNGLLNLFPAFYEGGNVAVRHHVLVDTNRALLAALRHRARTGSFPASLSNLRVPTGDRFNGQVLRFKKTPTEIRIYSVGPNLEDDGGITSGESTAKGKRSDDIVAIYPPLKLRT